jgi:hypothetical protein
MMARMVRSVLCAGVLLLLSAEGCRPPVAHRPAPPHRLAAKESAASGAPAEEEAVPLARDEQPAGSPFTAGKLAGRIHDRSLTLRWAPWWLAPLHGEEARGETVHVRVGAAMRAVRGQLWLAAHLSLHDDQGSLQRELDVPLRVYSAAALADTFYQADFSAPELAAQLGLPAAADPSLSADPFTLLIYEREGTLTGELSSVRGGNRCPLLTPPEPAKSRCHRYASSLVLSEPVTEETTLETKLGKQLTPRALVKILQKGPLRVDFGDGPSALHYEVTPEGFACLTRGRAGDITPNDDVIGRPPPERATQVVVPVRFVLRSEDGRLNVSLAGTAESTIYEQRGWSGSVDAASGLTPVDVLHAVGQAIGFFAPAQRLSFLAVMLSAGPAAQLTSQLRLQSYALYPGVPPFPGVSEPASNRASCFGTYQHAQEATLEAAAR